MASETPTKDSESRGWSKGTVVQRPEEQEEHWHPVGIAEWRKIGRGCRRIGGRRGFSCSRSFTDPLAKFCNLLPEVDDLMLRGRIRGFYWDPGLHVLGDDLGNVLGVVGLVHEFPIFPCFGHRDAVDVEAAGLELFRNSVMKTTDAISLVGITYIFRPEASFLIQWLFACW